ncbi:MAG: hypothetical protein EA399_13975 [Desulfovibrionales bacterium]|nr:MAG: hypothetical protein EA399_13975 [Desulfovibrionales bacterium]
MNEGAKYLKIVKWFDEDQCFIGQCPGVIDPYCHGNNEKDVYAELCEIVDERLDLLKKEGKPLPERTYGRGIAQKLAEAA